MLWEPHAGEQNLNVNCRILGNIQEKPNASRYMFRGSAKNLLLPHKKASGKM